MCQDQGTGDPYLFRKGRRTAFTWFAMQERAHIREEQPSANKRVIDAALSKKWNELALEHKQRYIQAADDDKIYLEIVQVVNLLVVSCEQDALVTTAVGTAVGGGGGHSGAAGAGSVGTVGTVGTVGAVCLNGVQCTVVYDVCANPYSRLSFFSLVLTALAAVVAGAVAATAAAAAAALAGLGALARDVARLTAV